MTRDIVFGPNEERSGGAADVLDGPQSVEERVAHLEVQVDTLIQAVRALVDGLERAPAQAAENDKAERGARLAHELLLSQGL